MNIRKKFEAQSDHKYGVSRILEDGNYNCPRCTEAWHNYRAGYLQALEDAASEADHFQKISTTPGHVCGECIAAVIRAMKGEG